MNLETWMIIGAVISGGGVSATLTRILVTNWLKTREKEISDLKEYFEEHIRRLDAEIIRLRDRQHNFAQVVGVRVLEEDKMRKR